MTTLARRLSNAGAILCYHNVVPEGVPSPWDRVGVHMPLAAFERQMRWLARNYDVIPLADHVRRVRRGGSLRGVAAVTFDDGYRGVFDYAWPLLQSLRRGRTWARRSILVGRPGGAVRLFPCSASALAHGTPG